MQLEQKQIGYILIGAAVVLALLTAWYTSSLMDASATGCATHCGDAGECPHAKNLPVQTYVGGAIILVLCFASYSLITNSKLATKSKKEIVNKVKRLPEKEKKIYKAIDAADGAMFQSELVEKTKLSKVKVSRLLDKLEGKGLVERRRRGMTNLVLLKKR